MVKGDKSNSWFITIKDILLKYDLPMPWFLLDTQPTKIRWKNQVKRKINHYWSEVMKSRASLYSSLKYLNYEAYRPGTRPPIIQDPNGVKEVPSIYTKIKMIPGTYVLQVNRASFNQNQISSTSLLCKNEDETMEHYLLRCESLESIRKPILDDILIIYEGLDQDDSFHLLQCILDPTVIFPDANVPELRILERHTRRLYT